MLEDYYYYYCNEFELMKLIFFSSVNGLLFLSLEKKDF